MHDLMLGVRRFGFLLAVGSAGCASVAALPEVATFGSQPTLPAPTHALIPTLNIAPAVGWPQGTAPVPAAGLAVSAYATGLDHPRWLYVLPNGDLLVAETNAPVKHDADSGLKGWIMQRVIKTAGAAVPSADRITLLRDADHDGRAESRTVFLGGLHSPFGMALVEGNLYVANTDAILRFPYQSGQTRITAPGVEVMTLPAGDINHHWTKDLRASRDGRHLYVTVGSNSNAGENGAANEAGRAAIYEFEIASGRARLYATGLRNPNGLSWQPHSGALWVAVNERDELGNDLVPDYMTSVTDGGFYGWPYSYYGQHVDARAGQAPPGLVAKALVPDYALGAHTASLGLTFNASTLLPAKYQGGAFVSLHGSWNRKPRSGYKVIFVPFADGHPAGPPEDLLTGFISTAGRAFGRPVGIVIDGSGVLLVADDVGNVVWRVTPTAYVR